MCSCFRGGRLGFKGGRTLAVARSSRLRCVRRLVGSFPRVAFRVTTDAVVSSGLAELSVGGGIRLCPYVARRGEGRLFREYSVCLSVGRCERLCGTMGRTVIGGVVVLTFSGATRSGRLCPVKGVFRDDGCIGVGRALGGVVADRAVFGRCVSERGGRLGRLTTGMIVNSASRDV